MQSYIQSYIVQRFQRDMQSYIVQSYIGNLTFSFPGFYPFHSNAPLSRPRNAVIASTSASIAGRNAFARGR